MEVQSQQQPVGHGQAQPLEVVIDGFSFQPGPGNWKFGLCGCVGNGGICSCKPGMCEAFVMAFCCASCRVAQMAGRLGHSAWIGIAVMFFIAEAMNIYGTEHDQTPTYDDNCNRWVSDNYPAISPNDAPTTYLSIPSTDTYWFDTCRPKQFAKFGIKLALAIAGWIGMTAVLLMIRRAVVAKYQIHETAWKSWVLSCFCGFCTLYQVSAEVDFAERGRLDALSTDCKVRSALPRRNPACRPPNSAACTRWGAAPYKHHHIAVNLLHAAQSSGSDRLHGLNLSPIFSASTEAASEPSLDVVGPWGHCVASPATR